jgi:hypothetical protein
MNRNEFIIVENLKLLKIIGKSHYDIHQIMEYHMGFEYNKKYINKLLKDLEVENSGDN